MDILYNSISFKTHLGLKWKKSNHLNSFEDNVEIRDIQGASGALIIDLGGQKNKDIEIVCNLDGRGLPLLNLQKSIISSLKPDKNYHRLEFSDGFKFDAIVKGQIVFNELFNNFYEVSIVFSAKEVKDEVI